MFEALMSNEIIQQAVVALVVGLISIAIAWVKRKVSTIDLVNDNWDYIKPYVKSAIEQAQAAVQAGTWGTAMLRDIATRSLADVAAEFRLYEGAEPSLGLLAAASSEIEQALLRVTGGVK